jgi:hypothetical protein
MWTDTLQHAVCCHYTSNKWAVRAAAVAAVLHLSTHKKESASVSARSKATQGEYERVLCNGHQLCLCACARLCRAVQGMRMQFNCTRASKEHAVVVQALKWVLVWRRARSVHLSTWSLHRAPTSSNSAPASLIPSSSTAAIAAANAIAPWTVGRSIAGGRACTVLCLSRACVSSGKSIQAYTQISTPTCRTESQLIARAVCRRSAGHTLAKALRHQETKRFQFCCVLHAISREYNSESRYHSASH